MTSTETWPCPTCATTNRSSDRSCLVCGQARPGVRADRDTDPDPTVTSYRKVGADEPGEAVPPDLEPPRRIPVLAIVIATIVVAASIAVLAYLTTRPSADRVTASSRTTTDERVTDTESETTDTEPDDTDTEPESTSTEPDPHLQLEAALDLTQQWADALAAGDWAGARQIQPALTPDEARLKNGYGDLDNAVIQYVSGDGTKLRVASIAHEKKPEGAQTQVFCFAVTVDQSTTTIQVQEVPVAENAVPGWLEPDDLQPAIQTCADAP